MNMLRTSLVCAFAMGLLAAGCGDDDRPPGGVDSGSIRIDAGPPGDSGPVVPRDAGPGGSDSGGGTGMCPAGACDLLTNGCDPGQACYFLSPAMGSPPEPICQPSGTGTTGTACMNYGDCAEGFICVPGPGTPMMGVCQHYCCGGSRTGCPAGQSCTVQFTDAMGRDLGVGYCNLPDVCDPTATPTGCDTGEGCYIGEDGSGTCIASVRNLMEGATCMPANDCAPGLACYSIGGGGNQCYRYCDMTAMPSQCSATQMCVNLMSPGHPNLGLCVSMMAGG